MVGEHVCRGYARGNGVGLFAVADFAQPMQSQLSARYFAHRRHTHVMDWQRSAGIFKFKDVGTVNGCLEPGSVMKGGVVIAQHGVRPAGAYADFFIGRETDLRPLQVHADSICRWICFKTHLRKVAEVF